jgi:hypothetical protein
MSMGRASRTTSRAAILAHALVEGRDLGDIALMWQIAGRTVMVAAAA